MYIDSKAVSQTLMFKIMHINVIITTKTEKMAFKTTFIFNVHLSLFSLGAWIE